MFYSTEKQAEISVEQMSFCSISPNIIQEEVFQKTIPKYLCSLIELAKRKYFLFSIPTTAKTECFCHE
jgi:hypothetical protein